MKFATQFTQRKHVAVVFKEPTMTKQAPANDVDINTIMARYIKATGLTGSEILDRLDAFYAKQQFGDATAIPTLEQANNMIAEANALFEALPAKAREKFANSPANFLAFMEDPNNKEEAIKLGLAVRKEQPVVSEKPVVEPVVATQTTEPVSQ